MTNRPNVLLFLMDGVQAAALEEGSGCLTPNFDRLAQRGVTFERCYTPSPTCSPARGSLMTGLLPHNHGVLEVEHGRDSDQVELRRHKRHWAQNLQDTGYQTAYFGKWHIERSNRLEDFGWGINHCKAAEHHKHLGTGTQGGPEVSIDPEMCRYLEGHEGYNRILHYGVTDVAPKVRYPAYSVNQTLEFLGTQESASSPWCACVSFSEPNESLIVSRNTLDRYDVDTIPLPENLRDDLSDRPGIYRRQREISADVTDDEWRMARACYFGRITELDDQFGRIMDYLSETGQLEITVVIVTADHGRYVGGHGFDAHNFGPFEEIYRVPLVIAGPGVVEREVTEGLVSLQDLCPTLLELTGADAIPETDATSFVSLLQQPQDSSGFESTYSEYHGTRFRLTQRILWQGDWKFVFNGFDYDELYNLAEDPFEMRNVVNEPDNADRVRSMMGEIWNCIRESGDRTLNETHYYSMRFGAVGPNVSDSQ